MAKRKATAAKGRAKAKISKEQSLYLQLVDAAERGREWLGQRSDYWGYLVRRSTSRGAPELARHLQGDLRAKQGRDGSWYEGDLYETSEGIWRMLDLGLPARAQPIGAAVEWLYGRRDEEGAYGSGCTPARHEQRICEHFINGFFSPGPSDEPVEVTLPNGQAVTSDAGARLIMSERGLRAALRAYPGDPRAAASIAGLRGLPLYLEYGGTYTPAVLVGALQALAWTSAPYPGELEAGLESLAQAQDKKGDWPNVEFFFVLETLLEVRHPLAKTLLRKTTSKLLDTQHKSGDWGRRHQAAQTWIGVRALESAAEGVRAEGL